MIRVLLIFSALLFFAGAAGYKLQLYFFSSIVPFRADSLSPEAILSARKTLFFIGLFLLLLSECLKRVTLLLKPGKKRWAENLTLALLTSLLPVIFFEVSLRPVRAPSQTKTTIFIKDSELGWKLRPGAEDIYAGVKVRVNTHGLRGPDVEYEKSKGVSRILFLGDSVTFGTMLESYRQAFPYLVGENLKKATGLQIETINSGVSGYSPWQEYTYLATEGIRYEPDLVVLSFVLNDVTEKFSLKRFGGFWEGFQLSRTRTTLDLLSEYSGIADFIKRAVNRTRLGSDLRKGAIKKELSDVRLLAESPEEPYIKKAWSVTQKNMRSIFDFCKSREIPVLVAIFPFTFQFRNIDTLSAPQKNLISFSRKNNVSYLDLLPQLYNIMKNNRLKMREVFIDNDHLTPLGSQIVAELISRSIQKQKLLNLSESENR